jgi:DnaJ-class molecular chaperone
MVGFKTDNVSTEVKCSACNGTGFPVVVQPTRPGRRIYPPPCKLCSGKGRINPA